MSMTVQERYADIARRSGMSEEIVKRVLDAEQQSVIDTLEHGERATLIGRCVIIPELRNKLYNGCILKNKIKLTATVTHSLESTFKDLEGFKPKQQEDEDNIPNGVITMQLSSLV